MRAHDFIAEATIRDQIVADFRKDGGNIDDYYVRFTGQDKLGYSARQSFGHSPDVDNPDFDLEYIGYGKGRPALWFYPLSYYLKNKDLYATKHPHVWLVKLKPTAWLQTVDRKTNTVEPAPAGKQRVGIMKLSSVPSAIFFKPGFDVVKKYYDYAGQHQRHGQVKGRPAPTFMDRLRGVTESQQTPADAWIKKVYDQYQDWPYGRGDKVMVWGEGEDQQFAVFALKPVLGKTNQVDIDWFQAHPQRQGVGSRAMAELQKLAQSDGIGLKLFPWDKGQVSQAALKRFYKRAGFNPIGKGATSMQWDPEQLEEGLKDWVAALAATGALALGTPADAKQAPVAPQTQSVEQVSQVLAKPAAQVLKKTAIKAGIVGTELAQFMAQCAHETANFTSMKEHGGSLDFKKYDIKHNPRKARALGNVKPGDGAKFAGRGFIQLTGRDNYKRAGQALGLPLEQQPELVEHPDVAAKVAVWFWQSRVAPKVASFHDTKQATKPINPGMRGLADRQAKFNAIKQGAMATPQQLAPRGRKI
jgi:predicted chitinase/GNAT superfamily N-acetyltransferase